jgi:hypothetical protein
MIPTVVVIAPQTVDIAESVRWLTALTKHVQQAVGNAVRNQIQQQQHHHQPHAGNSSSSVAGGAPSTVRAALANLCGAGGGGGGGAGGGGAGTSAQFKERAAKSSQMTVGELWAKQLVQIPKISAAGARCATCTYL